MSGLLSVDDLLMVEFEKLKLYVNKLFFCATFFLFSRTLVLLVLNCDTHSSFIFLLYDKFEVSRFEVLWLLSWLHSNILPTSSKQSNAQFSPLKIMVHVNRAEFCSRRLPLVITIMYVTRVAAFSVINLCELYSQGWHVSRERRSGFKEITWHPRVKSIKSFPRVSLRPNSIWRAKFEQRDKF